MISGDFRYIFVVCETEVFVPKDIVTLVPLEEAPPTMEEADVPGCELLTLEYINDLLVNGTSPEWLFIHYWWCSPESVIHWLVKTFTPPLLIIFGSIGNILAFIVLSRKMLQQWSVCLYLAVYAIINTIVLYIGCGLDWVSYITDSTHVANKADWVCRLWKFFFNVISYSTGWIVVAMTMDRFVMMWYPRKAQQLCTVFMAKLSIVIIMIGLIVLSIHAMWTFALTPHGCIIEADAHMFQTTVWPIGSAIFYSYFPIVLLFTLDIFLILGTCNHASRGDNNPTQLRLTQVALIVSLTYLLLSLPTIILNIFVYCRPHLNQQIHTRALIFLLQEICQTLSCLNNSLSFIIYFGSVPMIRQELGAMVNVLKRSRQTLLNEELHTVGPKGNMVSKQDLETTATLL